MAEDAPVAVEFGAQAGVAALSVRNVGMGAGTLSRGDGQRLHNTAWMDGYVKPWVKAAARPDELVPGQPYAGASVLWGWTLGDGDAYAVPGGTQATDGRTAHTDLESLYAGWRSGEGAGMDSDGIDLSAGRQEFVLGDGFLIADGNYDTGKDAGYYSGGRQAWTGTAIARMALAPLRADLFWLKADKHSGSSQFVGINLEHAGLGAAWMRVVGDDETVSGYAGRRGLQVWDLRYRGNPLESAEGLTLAGEFVLERNRGATRKNARGWYAEAGYQWAEEPWRPSLTFRHARFGGDDPDTAANEGFDPLRYGATGGWGTWFMGEIAGQYMLFNANEVVNMVHAKVSPDEQLTLGVLAYAFHYEEPRAVANAAGGTGVGQRHFGDELNVYVDWAPLDWLSLSAVGGLFRPGGGGAEAYGASSNTYLIGTMATLRY